MRTTITTSDLVTRGDTTSGAIFDVTDRFRYILWRQWETGTGAGSVCFVLLNPSTADHKQNDPTITRCIGWAKRLGYGSLQIVNLFALRSTDSSRLYKTRDPIGPKNDSFVTNAVCESDSIIVAWGNHGLLRSRHEAIMTLMPPSRPIHCFGTTKLGQPKHPLYLPGDTALREFRC